MIESFVDLTYRGLSLGRRVKLTQVRPTSGYVEAPAPMPVGTAIVITTDEGVVLDATVTAIHEQVGGSARPPGMVVTPALADDARVSWWSARIAPEPPPEPPVAAASTVSERVTVRPRSHTVPAPPPEGVVVEPLVPQAEPPDGRTVAMAAVVPDLEPEPAELKDDGRATTVMQAIDPDTLARLTATSELEALITTGKHAVIDDGKKTVMMDAIDPAALGLDVSASGSFPAADDDSGATSSGGDDKKAGGGAKKRRKRR